MKNKFTLCVFFLLFLIFNLISCSKKKPEVPASGLPLPADSISTHTKPQKTMQKVDTLAIDSVRVESKEIEIPEEKSTAPSGYETFKSHQVYYLLNDNTNPSCTLNIDFDYPIVFSDEKLLPRIQKIFISEFFGKEYAKSEPNVAMTSFANKFISEYKETEKYFLQEKKSGSDKDICLSCYIYEYYLSNSIVLQNDKYLSFMISTYRYTGGAHGASSIRGYNIDLKTGKLLSIKDILSFNRQMDLEELLVKNLMKEKGCKTVEELNDKDYNVKDIKISDNFILRENGIGFIYGEYEIGPYSLGITEIPVSYEELKPFLK